MKENKTIIYVIATILIALILIFYKAGSNTTTRTSDVQTIQSENKTIYATKRKQEILKQIDQINKTLAETLDQGVIDQLAKEKEILMHEYMQLDQTK